MASRLIFLHHHDVLKQRGRPGISQKVIGSAYPGHRLGRSSQLKGTGEMKAQAGFEWPRPRDEKSRLWSIACDRTANRHRYSRRESSGVRDNYR